VPDDQPTIQAAVNAASNGDVIYVRAGDYPESVYVDKPLKIIAEGAGREVKSVKINPTPEGGTTGFYINSDDVTIVGFEIADTNYGILFHKGSSFNKFSNNYIHDMNCTYECGGSGASDGGWGIALWDFDGGSDYNLITNNVIENIEIDAIILHVPTGAYPGTGINTGNIIVKDKIRNAGTGINIAHGQNTTINHNIIRNVKFWGISLGNEQEDVASNHNTIAHNYIKGVYEGSAGILLAKSGGSADRNNIHHNDIQDIINGPWWNVGIYIQGNYNLIHHNSVKNAENPYRDTGEGNKFFKNKW